MTKQISIVGAGIAGLVLGQLLRKRQIPAIVWEKSKHYPSLQNFGITLHASAYLPLLKALDIDTTVLQKDAVIKPVNGHQQATDSTVRVNRSQLLGLLGKDLDVRWSHKLVGIDRGSQAQHKLSFQNEQGKEVQHESDIIVAADGVHSMVRSVLGLPEADFKLSVLPFVVYNGKRTFPTSQLPEGLSDCLNDPNGLTLVRGETLLKITSGYHDLVKKEVAINYTLSRAAGPQDDDLLGRTKSDAESLARRVLQEAGQLSDLHEPFKSIYDPEQMRNDRLLHWLMRSAVLSLEALTQHAERGIYIFGDAANSTPILGGSGANNAMTSALQLVEIITGNARNRAGLLQEMHRSWVDWKDDSEQSLQAMHASNGLKAAM